MQRFLQVQLARHHYRMKKKGFTLVEILVVMTIIAVLIGVGLVSYQGARKSSRDAKRKADLEQIRSALEIYRTDCKTYPNPITQLSDESSCNGSIYMAEVPGDPGSCRYVYTRSSANTYTLCAQLEIPSSVVVDINGCGSCGTGCACNYKTINP